MQKVRSLAWEPTCPPVARKILKNYHVMAVADKNLVKLETEEDFFAIEACCEIQVYKVAL